MTTMIPTDVRFCLLDALGRVKAEVTVDRQQYDRLRGQAKKPGDFVNIMRGYIAAQQKLAREREYAPGHSGKMRSEKHEYRNNELTSRTTRVRRRLWRR